MSKGVTANYGPLTCDLRKTWQVSVIEREPERGVGIYIPYYKCRRSTVAGRRFSARALCMTEIVPRQTSS